MSAIRSFAVDTKLQEKYRPGIAGTSRNQNAHTSEQGTYRWGLKMRLILEAWSFSQSRSSSPCSMPNFLLLGLMGGGPVRWLVRADTTGMVCILGSPLRAASPTQEKWCSHQAGEISLPQAPAPFSPGPLRNYSQWKVFGSVTRGPPFSEHGPSTGLAAKHETFYINEAFYHNYSFPPRCSEM